jgi:hypothetical protein
MLKIDINFNTCFKVRLDEFVMFRASYIRSQTILSLGKVFVKIDFQKLLLFSVDLQSTLTSLRVISTWSNQIVRIFRPGGTDRFTIWWPTPAMMCISGRMKVAISVSEWLVFLSPLINSIHSRLFSYILFDYHIFLFIPDKSIPFSVYPAIPTHFSIFPGISIFDLLLLNINWYFYFLSFPPKYFVIFS